MTFATTDPNRRQHRDRDRRRIHRPHAATVVRGVIGAILIGAALWGMDWTARIGAESLIARKIQSAEQLEQRPTVRVHGAFFLPQVVAGRYNNVQVVLRGIVTGPLRIDRLDTHLHGVHIPLHGLVTGSIKAIPIDSTTGTATLLYTDLDHYLSAQGLPLHVSQSSNGDLRVTGTVSVLSTSASVSAIATIALQPGKLKVTPVKLGTGLSALDAVSKALLNQRLTFTIPLAALPFGQQVQDVHIEKNGVRVDVAGRHVILRTNTQVGTPAG